MASAEDTADWAGWAMAGLALAGLAMAAGQASAEASVCRCWLVPQADCC